MEAFLDRCGKTFRMDTTFPSEKLTLLSAFLRGNCSHSIASMSLAQKHPISLIHEVSKSRPREREKEKKYLRYQSNRHKVQVLKWTFFLKIDFKQLWLSVFPPCNRLLILILTYAFIRRKARAAQHKSPRSFHAVTEAAQSCEKQPHPRLTVRGMGVHTRVTPPPSLLLKYIAVVLCLPEPQTKKKTTRVFSFNSLLQQELKSSCEFYDDFFWQRLK